MRNTFIAELCRLAEADERIWLLTGDLGFSVLERFAEKFPKRFINAGVAEQNLTGVAAGLALAGKIVFTYSIANFPLLRCLEQIRNDVCYHQANVKIVAVGGGLCYGAQGYTHHGVEDLAALRVLPGMTVVAPGDPVETRLAARALAAAPGPAYLRLGKGGESAVHESEPAFQLGRALRVREGRELTYLTTGGVLPLAAEACAKLAATGRSAGLISLPTVEPLDQEAVLNAARTTGHLVTVEEHGPGGLAAAVGELLATAGATGPDGRPCRFVPLRLRRIADGAVGSQEELRRAGGLGLADLLAAAEPR